MWTLGAQHTLLGTGEVAIASPAALAISVLSTPLSANAKLGTPATWYGVGHITPGTANGWLRDISLQHLAQVEVLPAPYFTRLGYTLQPEVNITVRELLEDSVASRPFYDRNATPVVASNAPTIAGPVGWTMLIDYLVPTGKKLLLHRLGIGFSQLSAPTSVAGVHAYWKLDAVYAIYRSFYGATVGSSLEASAPLSDMYLPAGRRLQAHYASQNTGGWTTIGMEFHGTLFDA